MQEKENVVRILKETKLALEKGDALKIKNLSNQTINTASMTQDLDNIAVAVIVYSIGKILERENYKKLAGWDVFQKVVEVSLTNSISDLEKNNEKKFRKDLESVRTAIGKLSGKLKEYIESVFQKAQINKASRLYEHGISMEQTAKLLGVSMYELADYVGKTGISDVAESKTISVRDRIKMAMEIFG
ncbi:MAG: hypothetical protein KJ949_01790 [Nanoarchaeota archaeon]|nr:hypothetical protein [Nanoarchaeota archaeon]